MAGVGDLVWRIGDDQAQVRYLVIGRSGGQVTPYVIHIVHMEHTRSACFFDLASKLVMTVCPWFGLKTTAMISWFGPQNQGRRFGDLDLKITVMVSWFGPQPSGRRFVGLHLKTDERMKTV
jgi:hypothetical protein